MICPMIYLFEAHTAACYSNSKVWKVTNGVAFFVFFFNMLKAFPSSSFRSPCLPAVSSYLLLCLIGTLKIIFTGWPFSSDIVLRVGMSHKQKESENDHSTSHWLIGDWKHNGQRRSKGTSGHLSRQSSIFKNPLVSVRHQHSTTSLLTLHYLMSYEWDF